MSSPDHSPKAPPRPALAAAVIALSVGALGLAFAASAGWIGPDRVSGSDVANALEGNAGLHEGYRRAHAKGLCFSGYFEANGAGVAFSEASLFREGRYPVTGRFSMAGSNPFAADGRNVFHSMAFILKTPDGQEWRTGMDHAEIFPVADVASFIALQQATSPDPVTGKPDPDKVAAYMAAHPETRAFGAYLNAAPLPDSFTNGPYYSINAFRFTNAEGETRFVRWSMQPEDPLVEIDKSTLPDLPQDAVFEKTLARLNEGPARWHMQLEIAEPGDVTDNPTVIWPASRQTVDAGTLVVTAAEPEETGACRDYTFDPTILPPGMAPSDDPILAARSSAYLASFTRRAGEGVGPSAFANHTAAGEKQ